MKERFQPLDSADGQLLLKLARSTLMGKFGRGLPAVEVERLQSALAEPRFQARRGTFVTLTLAGKLRGCIGNLFPTDPLAESIRCNAVQAAFQDPRFAPLTEVELGRTTIEISILTDPRPVSFSSARDLAQKLRPHLDGAIIRQGHASATFLPQVWSQLPKAEDFLDHLCLKAGLPRDAWKHCRLEVATYQVQCFEDSPC